jgi:membrane-associated phospholipid phosphatase
MPWWVADVRSCVFRLGSHPCSVPTPQASFLIVMSVGLPLMVVVVISLLSPTACCLSIIYWPRSTASTIYVAPNKNGSAPNQTIRQQLFLASIGALATCIGLSEGMTQLLKLYIQRRRPNFYSLCGFDTISRRCMANDPIMIREAHLSFPSGHSSLAMAGMTFLVWYCLSHLLTWSCILPIIKTTSVTQGGSHTTGTHTKIWMTLCIILVCVVPWSWALWVGATRMIDQWHHPSDVVAGLCLGWFMSNLGYHLWFPNPMIAYYQCFSQVLLRMLRPRRMNDMNDEEDSTTTNGPMIVQPTPAVPWLLMRIALHWEMIRINDQPSLSSDGIQLDV